MKIKGRERSWRSYVVWIRREEAHEIGLESNDVLNQHSINTDNKIRVHCDERNSKHLKPT